MRRHDRAVFERQLLQAEPPGRRRRPHHRLRHIQHVEGSRIRGHGVSNGAEALRNIQKQTLNRTRTSASFVSWLDFPVAHPCLRSGMNS